MRQSIGAAGIVLMITACGGTTPAPRTATTEAGWAEAIGSPAPFGCTMSAIDDGALVEVAIDAAITAWASAPEQAEAYGVVPMPAALADRATLSRVAWIPGPTGLCRAELAPAELRVGDGPPIVRRPVRGCAEAPFAWVCDPSTLPPTDLRFVPFAFDAPTLLVPPLATGAVAAAIAARDAAMTGEARAALADPAAPITHDRVRTATVQLEGEAALTYVQLASARFATADETEHGCPAFELEHDALYREGLNGPHLVTEARGLLGVLADAHHVLALVHAAGAPNHDGEDCSGASSCLVIELQTLDASDTLTPAHRAFHGHTSGETWVPSGLLYEDTRPDCGT